MSPQFGRLAFYFFNIIDGGSQSRALKRPPDQWHVMQIRAQTSAPYPPTLLQKKAATLEQKRSLQAL